MRTSPFVRPAVPAALLSLLAVTGCGGDAAEGGEMPDAPPLSGIVLHDGGDLVTMDPDSGAVTAEYSLPDRAANRQSFSTDWTMFTWASGGELYIADYAHEESGYVETTMVEPPDATYSEEEQRFTEARFNPEDDTIWVTAESPGFGQGGMEILEVSPDAPEEPPQLVETFDTEDAPGDDWSISEEGELLRATGTTELELGVAQRSTLQLTRAASITDMSMQLDDGEGTRRNFELAHMVDDHTALLYTRDTDTESTLAGTYGSAVRVILGEDRSSADIEMLAPATPHGIQFALLDPDQERLLLEVGGGQGWHENDPDSADLPSPVEFEPEARLAPERLLEWRED
ncbi:hypothetical protein RIF23_17735 [Lipingzhangella sp. LS1_29]|uniref:WD40 repeat protein n=1 Tax=Lipingzhangella rawalii TaxID=2055835 RepID=A0ABU2HC06_9ACTN|nr:hypothetical protein [Lipingzhangella rawalii]MDS1272134.1 hypothetical protein [Lipingzhangella rawalii]